MADQIVQHIKECYQISEKCWTSIYRNVDLCHNPHYEEIAASLQVIRHQQNAMLQYTSQLYEVNLSMMMKIVRLKEEAKKQQDTAKHELQVSVLIIYYGHEIIIN